MMNFDFYVDKIIGGNLLGVASSEFILFYDWTGENLIGKIDTDVQEIFWGEELFFLKSSKQSYMIRLCSGQEDPFQVSFETAEQIYHGYWLQGLFFFTDTQHKFKVFLSGKCFTLASFKSSQVISDYLKNHDRFFFFDSSSNVSSFFFSKQLLSLLEKYFIDLDPENMSGLVQASQPLSLEEKDFLSKVLISFDLKEQAYEIIANVRGKFDLALDLGKLQEAIAFCEELKDSIYWKKLGDFAMLNGDFDICTQAYRSCQDSNSLLILATCLGQRELLEEVAEMAVQQKHYSVAFVAYLNLQNVEKCLWVLTTTHQYSKALIFCKNYIPS